MAKVQTYPMEKILAAREALRKLPTKEKGKSRREVVAFLKGDLRKAVKQGHSLKEIQAILAEQGISVSLSGMEAVLGQSGKDLARKKSDFGQPSPKVTEVNLTANVPKSKAVKPETRKVIPAQKSESAPLPSYFTPDVPDSEL